MPGSFYQPIVKDTCPSSSAGAKHEPVSRITRAPHHLRPASPAPRITCAPIANSVFLVSASFGRAISK